MAAKNDNYIVSKMATVLVVPIDGMVGVLSPYRFGNSLSRNKLGS